MHLLTPLITTIALLSVTLAYPYNAAVTPIPALRRDNIQMTTSKGTTSTTKHTTSHTTTPTTRSTPTTTTTTVKSTSTTPLCNQDNTPGLVFPKDGHVYYYNSTDPQAVTIHIVYCSGAYGETESLYGDAWLGSVKEGDILSLQHKPDNVDAQQGGYSYNFKTTFLPVTIDGPTTGPQQFNFYEVATGLFTEYSYTTNFITVYFHPK